MKKKYKNFQELMQDYPSLKTNLSVEKDLVKKGFNVVLRLGVFNYQNEACDVAAELSKVKNNKINEVIDGRLQKALAELSGEGLIKFKDGLHTLAKATKKGAVH